MNHYEIVYIFNPDEKEQGKSLFNKILETTKSIKGQIHRSEEIGSRRLAYPIKDFYRGEYFLINLECNSSELASITDLFKFNENILRTSVLKKKQPETNKSALMEQTKESSYEKDLKDDGLIKKVSNEAKEVLSKAEEVVEDAIEEVKEAAEKVEEVVEDVVEEVVEKAEGIVEAAEEVVEDVVEKAEEVVEDAIEEVKEAAEKVEEVVEEAVEEAKEKAKGVFAKVKNVFKSDKK